VLHSEQFDKQSNKNWNEVGKDKYW